MTVSSRTLWMLSILPLATGWSAVTGNGQLACYEARTGADARVLGLKDVKASRIKFSLTDSPLLYVGDTEGKIHILEFDEHAGVQSSSNNAHP